MLRNGTNSLDNSHDFYSLNFNFALLCQRERENAVSFYLIMYSDTKLCTGVLELSSCLLFIVRIVCNLLNNGYIAISDSKCIIVH